MGTVAALYVEEGGVYSLDGVDVWGVSRDARLYPGPHPVVAHPPCERWGRYWSGGPSHHGTRLKGNDGGCFAAALHSVRMWGGVLEHPADSIAWDWHGLIKPSRSGGWSHADGHGWACCVEQGWYGHQAKKRTWLYAVRCELPSLRWGSAPVGAGTNADAPANTAEERAKLIKRGVTENLSKQQRSRTPGPFASLLITMARGVQPATKDAQ